MSDDRICCQHHLFYAMETLRFGFGTIADYLSKRVCDESSLNDFTGLIA
jgi:hypothetical protein